MFRTKTSSRGGGLRLQQLEAREVPANHAPIPFYFGVSTFEDSPVTSQMDGSDAEGDALTFRVIDQPLHGTVVVQADGRTFTYTPDANYNNTSANPDRFTYVANDGQVDSADSATVTLVVAPQNDVPTLAPATFSLPENSANGTVVGTVLGADIEGDALTYSIVAGNSGVAFAINPATGQVTVNDGSVLDFETRPTYVLTVQATDTSGVSVTAPVTINLTDVVETITVGVDIRPGGRHNRIHLDSEGKVAVAILSTATFDAQQVDVNSLRFGRTGQENSLSRNRHGRVRFEYDDVNCDGRLDLVAKFEIELTGFRIGDTRGIITGRLVDGTSLYGEDMVRIRC